MEEIWKPVPGYEGLYEASTLGNIRNAINGRVLRQSNHRQGYKLVGLHKDKKLKTHTVHRLIAKAFIENPNGYNEVNHKDENKANNNIENLEWCTRMYNVHYGTGLARKQALNAIAIKEGRTSKNVSKNRGEKNPNAKLTDEDVLYIRTHYKQNDKEFGGIALAERFGITPGSLYRIIGNKRRQM